MLDYHYLYPESAWGVFDESGACVAIFLTPEEAAAYCDRHNNKKAEEK